MNINNATGLNIDKSYNDKRVSKDNPFVSVIMPIRNESAYIEQSLGAVLSQEYPHERMEVLIADGMSTDNTREIINGLANTQDIPVTIIDNKEMIVPTGMNAAISEARGEILVRVDGHAVIRPDYIRLCVDYLIKNNVECVGGIVESIGKGYIGKAIAVVMSSHFGVGASGFRVRSSNSDPMPVDTVPFGAFRRVVFDRVGKFNEEMVRHQDYEFNYRLRKAGGTIMLLPAARAKYYVRTSIARLWKQYWQYGIWKGRFLRKYPDSLRFRHMVPPMFLLLFVLSLIISIVNPIGISVFTLALGAYIFFLIGVLIIISLKGHAAYIPVLPLIFGCIHIGWGFGVWRGLLFPLISDPRYKKD